MSHTCHAICTLSPLVAALTMRVAKTRNSTRLKCCACHAKWRWRSPKCCACQEKCKPSSENLAKVLRLSHRTFWHVTKPVAISQSATPATRNEVAQQLKPPKVTSFAALPIGTAIGTSYEWRRRVANGCKRLRTVADGGATSSEYTLNGQSEMGTLATHSGKNPMENHYIHV